MDDSQSLNLDLYLVDIVCEHDGFTGRAFGGGEHPHLLKKLHVLGLRDAGNRVHTIVS